MDGRPGETPRSTAANYPYASEFLARIGVKTWINAENWSTTIGGSYLEPRVVEAMGEAGRGFFDMKEFMEKACARVAELCHVEAAYVTSGAAAGIVVAVAACITGTNRRRMAMLYGGLEGRETLPNELIIQTGHSSQYDYQYYAGGGKLIRAGFLVTERHNVEEAISERTVGLVYVHSYDNSPRQLPFSVMAEIAREHDLPMLVDNAGVLPPKENLHRFTDEGADLVLISGGKGIRGPNNTGLILAGGRHGSRLLEAIKMQSFPRDGIGRPFKVGKEALAGLLAALEIFVERDEDQVYAEQLEVCRRIVGALEGIPSLQVRIIPNDEKNFEHPISARVPRVYMEWDAAALGFDAVGLDRIMASGDPPIRIRRPRLTQANTTTSGSIRLVDTYFLREGEDVIVGERLRQAFRSATSA